MFLSTNKKVTGVWNSEVGSRKTNGESRGHPISPVKYNLYFHCSEKTAFYIFTTVKYSFFFKYALYLINIFLYFITLYIIKLCYIQICVIMRHVIKAMHCIFCHINCVRWIFSVLPYSALFDSICYKGIAL